MGTVSSETELNQLLRLTARGWRLFPVKVRDKQPLVADWPNQATNDQKRLQIWLKTFPGCNSGLATGPDSWIFVVDVDREQGTQSLHDLERNDCARLWRAEIIGLAFLISFDCLIYCGRCALELDHYPSQSQVMLFLCGNTCWRRTFSTAAHSFSNEIVPSTRVEPHSTLSDCFWICKIGSP